MHLQEETEGSKEVQGLHFPHLALAFPVACYRLVTNFQETNRQQETHARSVNLILLSSFTLRLQDLPQGGMPLRLGGIVAGAPQREVRLKDGKESA